jgi:hypothetical protein
MLAYVFWHWPKPDVVKDTYRDNLLAFHDTLARNRPDGFEQSVVFTIKNPSWLETSEDAYEEWYLLRSSAALDQLNHAAVSGPCEEPHNRVARDAASGIAGLYRLRQGQHTSLSSSKFAVWFAKPNGVSYPDFYAQLQTLSVSAGVGLWGRQMTLGPTSEFCLLSRDQHSLPPGFAGESIGLRKIWSGQPKSL